MKRQTKITLITLGIAASVCCASLIAMTSEGHKKRQRSVRLSSTPIATPALQEPMSEGYLCIECKRCGEKYERTHVPITKSEIEQAQQFLKKHPHEVEMTARVVRKKSVAAGLATVGTTGIKVRTLATRITFSAPASKSYPYRGSRADTGDQQKVVIRGLIQQQVK